MKWFFIFLLSILSWIIIVPFALVHALLRWELDFKLYAISVDQNINSLAHSLLDTLFLKNRNLFRFGDMDKTISYNLGRNKARHNLNNFGLFVCFILHLIDENHVEKSYKSEV